jgi:gliding motility-associated-like protein
MLVWTWENTEPLTGLAESGLGNIPSWVASENTTDAPIEGVVTVTGQVDGCDPVEAGSYDVTVDPQATIVASPQVSTICSGESAGVTLEINTGDPLEWTALANPSVSGAMDGSGLEIQDVLTNTGTSASTVEYTVTALNPTCPGDDVVVEVEVLPGVPMQQLADVFHCPGELAQAVLFDAVDGLVWSWMNTEPATGLASDGVGDIPSWTATNEGVVDLTGTVTVTGQVGSCNSEEAGTYQITTYPTPQAEITVSPDGNLSCADGTANIALNFLTTGSSALNVNGPSVIDQGVNFATVDSAGTYTVDLVSTNGCEATQSFEVNPIDDIAITQVNASNPLCFGEASGVIDVQTDEDGTNLTWEWVGTNAITSQAEDLVAGTYFVVVTNAAGCQDSADATLINPAPLSVALVDSLVSECGEDNGFLLVAANGGVGSLEYNWNPGGSDPLLDGIDAGDYSLVVQDANGCELDTTFTMVCLELVPPTPNEFISPNNDGLNEAWFIDNILYYTEATVQVYNRWGVEVYRAEPPYLNDWDGTNNQGQVLPSATYFYVIDTKKKSQKPFTGFLELQTEKP